MKINLNKKLIFCAVLLIFLTTFVAYAKEGEVTAGQWVQKGIQFQDNKNFDSAISAYSQAIDLDPQMGQAFAQRGKAYIVTRQYDLAVADFTKSIEFDPKDGSLYWLRGLAYAGKGQHQVAIDEYNQTLRIDPNMYMAYWNSALSYERLGSYQFAMEAYQNFVKMAPPEYPNVEMAKKRLEALKAMDTGKIEATKKTFANVKDVTASKYIFDFLKIDYLALAFDKPQWKVGFQDNSNKGVIVEFVKANETVQNWTELVTVQFFSEEKNITPQQYITFLEKQLRSRYGDKVQVDILRVAESDAIIEYKILDQAGKENEHTISRVFRGKVSLGLAHYAAKPLMTPEQRSSGLGMIEGVKYSDCLPQ